MIKTIGSVCSGIESASIAWKTFNVRFEWFSEIASFPSKILAEKYPNIPNLGDMNTIPELILQKKIPAPELICGGTPCQAFSLAGEQKGLNDIRGNLTLKFVDIVNANDTVRLSSKLPPTYIFWENVEGVLSDKTNSFGHFISSLAGLKHPLSPIGNRWPNAGLLQGITRNVAWRVLDAKYFSLPQQRRRLYVIASGKNASPESILFEKHQNILPKFPKFPLTFTKENQHFEIFREYTDCLYSAYGTKWNGNAAAYNGSLFIIQNQKLRRFSPLEAERLMGLPDNYTLLENAKKTSRFQAIGNAWAVPVVKWIGKRLLHHLTNSPALNHNDKFVNAKILQPSENVFFYNFEKDIIEKQDGTKINCSVIPEEYNFSSIEEIISTTPTDDLYISPVGCYGIIRRKQEKNIKINPRLEQILQLISSQMSPEEIEKKSRIQKRGKYSQTNESLPEKKLNKNTVKQKVKNRTNSKTKFTINQHSLFNLIP